MLSFPHSGMMLSEMSSFLCKRERTHTIFPPRWDDVVQDELVLVQEGKLAHTSFSPWWDVVVRYELVLVQEGNLACSSFPLQWNDVVQDELVLV
jgi:hypothetical protein